jgi:hypothetical protein
VVFDRDVPTNDGSLNAWIAEDWSVSCGEVGMKEVVAKSLCCSRAHLI